jgi:hypothetical protein
MTAATADAADDSRPVAALAFSLVSGAAGSLRLPATSRNVTCTQRDLPALIRGSEACLSPSRTARHLPRDKTVMT